jgi:predicted RND superfamily exporter protein
LLTASLIVISFVPMVLTVSNFVVQLSRAGATGGAIARTMLTSSAEIVGNTTRAAVVGLVLGVGIAWGIFVYEATAGGVKSGTLAFDSLLASTIAATILAILVFAASVTLVGFISILIAGLVDLFLAIFCAAGVAGACFSIFGSITEGHRLADPGQRADHQHRPQRPGQRG